MKKITLSNATFVVRFVLVVALILAPLSIYSIANAAQITGRKVTLSSSAGAATAVQYDLVTAALPTSTAVKSVSLTACTTASGACTTPTGFVNSSSTLVSQPTGLGAASGWTVNTATAGSLRIVNAANATVPSGAVAVSWGNVTNPTAVNTTYYLRMTTYSDAAWTTPLDTGTIAVSTSQSITVTASVDETLTFCTGTSGVTSSSCSGATGSSVSLGTITPSTTGSGTSQIGISTNAGSGYSITYFGPTLTSGGDTITAIGATAAASAQGTEQFGINLRDNATPNVGTDPQGAGTATPTTQYNIVDSFAFVASTATSIASKGSEDDFRLFTVSYIANVAGLTEPGTYTTTINYVATATF